MEEAESEIRIVVRDGFFSLSKPVLDEKIKKIILRALKQIKIPSLREDAKKSLVRFYNKQYSTMRLISPTVAVVLLALNKVISGDNKDVLTAKQSLKAQGFSVLGRGTSARIIQATEQGVYTYGVPIQEFSQEYFQRVKPIYKQLEKQFPLDPDDITGRNSLRNKAEMEVRYQHNLDMVADLKAQGVRLVIASTHADCSERCAPWQGRVYSLDGTRGVTDDGRKFVPLEEATDIYYTTKSGKTYKNGLLGFNCRHYLVPYKSGLKFPEPNAKEERKQYEITLKQRQLERNVRRWKTKAITLKNSNRDEYVKARDKAKAWDKAYQEYSRKNNRAFYPSRTTIL